MTVVVLSLTLVFSARLIFVGWQTRSSSRVRIIERHIGVNPKPIDQTLMLLFARVHRLLAGDALNPWGTDERVTQTLRHCQDTRTLMQFRRSQLLCMLALQSTVILWSTLRNLMHRNISLPILFSLLLAAIPVSGWTMFNLKKNQAAKIQQSIDQQLSGVLELLAFSVSAGEPIVLAFERVAKLCSGDLANVLNEIPTQLAGGATVADALSATVDQTSSPAFTRSIRAVQTALDRGTPIAGVLRAQAAQARSINQQHLLQLAGKKEAAMMAPVVFFILPMIVFIALYPGLSALQLT